LRGPGREMVCNASGPTKRPHTAHELRNRAEQGFVRPYGLPHSVFAILAEYGTVLNGRSKSRSVFGIARPPVTVPSDLRARRRVLVAVLAARLLISDRLGQGAPSSVAFGEACVCRLTKPMGVGRAVHSCQTNWRSPGQSSPRCISRLPGRLTQKVCLSGESALSRLR